MICWLRRLLAYIVPTAGDPPALPAEEAAQIRHAMQARPAETRLSDDDAEFWILYAHME